METDVGGESSPLCESEIRPSADARTDSGSASGADADADSSDGPSDGRRADTTAAPETPQPLRHTEHLSPPDTRIGTKGADTKTRRKAIQDVMHDASLTETQRQEKIKELMKPRQAAVQVAPLAKTARNTALVKGASTTENRQNVDVSDAMTTAGTSLVDAEGDAGDRPQASAAVAAHPPSSAEDTSSSTPNSLISIGRPVREDLAARQDQPDEHDSKEEVSAAPDTLAPSSQPDDPKGQGRRYEVMRSAVPGDEGAKPELVSATYPGDQLKDAKSSATKNDTSPPQPSDLSAQPSAEVRTHQSEQSEPANAPASSRTIAVVDALQQQPQSQPVCDDDAVQSVVLPGAHRVAGIDGSGHYSFPPDGTSSEEGQGDEGAAPEPEVVEAYLVDETSTALRGAPEHDEIRSDLVVKATRDSLKHRFLRDKIAWAVIVFLLVALGLSVGLGVHFSQAGGGDGTPRGSPFNTSSPTAGPTQSPSYNASEVHLELVAGQLGMSSNDENKLLLWVRNPPTNGTDCQPNELISRTLEMRSSLVGGRRLSTRDATLDMHSILPSFSPSSAPLFMPSTTVSIQPTAVPSASPPSACKRTFNMDLSLFNVLTFSVVSHTPGWEIAMDDLDGRIAFEFTAHNVNNDPFGPNATYVTCDKIQTFRGGIDFQADYQGSNDFSLRFNDLKSFVRIDTCTVTASVELDVLSNRLVGLSEISWSVSYDPENTLQGLQTYYYTEEHPSWIKADRPRVQPVAPTRAPSPTSAAKRPTCHIPCTLLMLFLASVSFLKYVK